MSQIILHVNFVLAAGVLDMCHEKRPRVNTHLFLSFQSTWPISDDDAKQQMQAMKSLHVAITIYMQRAIKNRVFGSGLQEQTKFI
jgi:hypothetical protein